MTSRWWHHDDRDGVPARSGYDNTATSGYRQQPVQQQQYAPQSQLRSDAADFKPQPQGTATAAPGFNRTAGPAVAKTPLPKCWEYEDPLKDVHGPFDAAQIINWFAQDWFGADLKIRRIGQYWTMLEYVLEELKAEARGTAAPSAVYTSAPQQLPQAATTPATSYSAQHAADQWGTSSARGYSAAQNDGWGASAARADRGYGSSSAAAGTMASGGPLQRGRAAEDAGGNSSAFGGFGSEDYSIVRGRGARDREREGPGVQFGSDGKWERGHVITGESRRGGRGGDRSTGSSRYQDYDSYGDDYGMNSSSRESRRGRGRGTRGGDRGDRAAGGYGDEKEAVGYDRAARILEGVDDEEYGSSGRSRGLAARDARGPAVGGRSSTGTKERKQETAAAAAAPAREPAKSRSRREGKTSSSSDVAAAAAAATAAISSISLSTPPAAGNATAAVNTVSNKNTTSAGGWGSPAADIPAVADDDGWGGSSAPVGKWGDEPLDDASDGPAYYETAAAGPPSTSDDKQQPAAAASADSWGSAAPSSSSSPIDPADSAAAAAAELPEPQKQPEPDQAAANAAADKEHSEATVKKTESQPAAAAAGDEAAAAAAVDDDNKPKVSRVQQLIMLQEQLQQQEADKAKLSSPTRASQSPKNPFKPSASSGSLTDHQNSAAAGAVADAGETGKPATAEEQDQKTPAEAAADKARDSQTAVAADGGDVGSEGAGKATSVAGITAGIFSRVAGALMGSSSVANEKEDG